MVEIDGAQKSGSGALVRVAVSLCSLAGLPLRMFRIRDKREKPGLRPQHLLAVKACAGQTSGRVEGAEVGSREIFYYPGAHINSGDFIWDIGTAGSATMLALAVIPGALFAKGESRFTIRGGLFQDNAPTAFHMQKVVLPLLGLMGARVDLRVVRPGYVPKGNGELELVVEPAQGALMPFDKMRRGEIVSIDAIAMASHLAKQSVARRMAERSRELLEKRGFHAQMEIIEDVSAVQSGASLLVRARSDEGCLLGFDGAGKRGRSSESIAEGVVGGLLADLQTGAVVDRFCADQLIPFCGLAHGQSRFIAPCRTDHMESTLWLIEKILGCGTRAQGNLICIDGIGFFRK
ncbi:MAG: RNA 3'-terminal phosphate cyclase [Syntrophobacteraceae bacterium]|nr:RNA 3'-terminal phosphate cyclase [Syntrophobacteraceae bacterium]